MEKYIVQLEECPSGNGDLILPIPVEVLAHLDLKEGDEVNFKMQKDGSLIITTLVDG